MAERTAGARCGPDKNRTKGPDTRSSWVVAGACFIVTFVTFGMLRCYGLLYVSVLQVFASSREAASWPFSVSAAAMNLMGPVAGLLNRRFGCRRVVLVGCATAAAGSAACFFAPSVLFLTIAFGIVQGAACGVVMLQVPVTVNQHFVRYRTTAQGLAFSGATVATFIYPPLLEYLVREYGIRGTFLLVGGILLHGAIGGSMVRTPSWLRKKSVPWTPETSRDGASKYRCSENSSPDVVRVESEEDLHVRDVNCNRPGRILTMHPREPLKQVYGVQQLGPPSYVQGRPLARWALVRSPWEVEREIIEDTREQTQTLLPPPPLPCTHRGFPRMLVVRTVPERASETEALQLRPGAASPDSAIIERREDVLLKNSSVSGPSSSSSSTVVLVRDILKDLLFWLLTVSWASFLFAYITYILVIIDCVKDHGILEEDALFLFSAFSIGDLVGRLGFGWVTDRGYVRRKNFTMATSTTMGLTLLVLPLEWSYGYQMSLSVIVGITVGSTMILYVSLVADYMRQDQVAMTLGLIGFINGVMSLGRPALVGYFRDVHGSYDQLFYTVGALTVISALTWLLEPFVVQISRKKKMEDKACSTDGDLDTPT